MDECLVNPLQWNKKQVGETLRKLIKVGIKIFWNPIVPSHNYCSSCSRKICLPVIFPKNNRSDNLPGYLSKLKFKNLEIQLFLVTAVVLIQDICIWLQGNQGIQYYHLEIRKKSSSVHPNCTRVIYSSYLPFNQIQWGFD